MFTFNPQLAALAWTQRSDLLHQREIYLSKIRSRCEFCLFFQSPLNLLSRPGCGTRVWHWKGGWWACHGKAGMSVHAWYSSFTNIRMSWTVEELGASDSNTRRANRVTHWIFCTFVLIVLTIEKSTSRTSKIFISNFLHNRPVNTGDHHPMCILWYLIKGKSDPMLRIS